MEWLSEKALAQAHRDAYVATVRAALKGGEGHADFAARVGCTREYFQLLIKPDGDRVPGKQTAEQIARLVPLPAEQRADLLEHMLLASECRLRSARGMRQSVGVTPLDDVVTLMRDAHWNATYAANPAEAKPHFLLLRDLAEEVLRHPAIAQRPMAIVETCLLRHDAQSVLDQHGDALFHARLGRSVMRRLKTGAYRPADGRFDHYLINTAYAEAVTLTTLGLARQAGGVLEAAIAELRRGSPEERFWLPHIYRRQLAALTGLSRFTLVQADALANDAKSACTARGDPLDWQVSLLIDVSLARAYLRYGNAMSRYRPALSAKAAYRLLRPGVEAIDQIPYFGPLHRVVTLRTFAHASWVTRARDESEHYAQLALGAAESAGLEHQARVIRRELGAALDPTQHIGLPEPE